MAKKTRTVKRKAVVRKPMPVVATREAEKPVRKRKGFGIAHADAYDPDRIPFVIENTKDQIDPVTKFLRETQSNPGSVNVKGIVLRVRESENGKVEYQRIRIQSTKELLASVKEAEQEFKIREANEFETGSGPGIGVSNGLLVGQDYIQLMGGPFSKNQYIYNYLEMHARAWWEVNHNPIAKFAVSTIVNFVLGGKIKIVFDGDNEAQDLWDKFEKISKFHERIRTMARELSIYGEIMLRKQMTTIGPIRRCIDPSTCWEVVTDPVDIEKIYYYHLQYPTQYQMFTKDGIPMSEFVLEQVPAQDVKHIRVNVVSNEKRGRSDLLAILGYLKRINDYMSYRVVKVKNEAAFIWDVVVDGDDRDVADAQEIMSGPEPQAGSALCHNKAIEIQPLQTSGINTGSDTTWHQLLSMCAIGLNVPVQYFGISTESGGHTRASAVVAAEPVGKFFEERQNILSELADFIVQEWKDFAGITSDHRVIMPEIQIDERSAKIDDTIKSEQAGYFSKRMAAEMTAKEMKVNNYNYDDVKAERDADEKDKEQSLAGTFNPLTAPSTDNKKQLDGADKKAIKTENRG